MARPDVDLQYGQPTVEIRYWVHEGLVLPYYVYMQNWKLAHPAKHAMLLVMVMHGKSNRAVIGTLTPFLLLGTCGPEVKF
jgi:hypothetical protein